MDGQDLLARLRTENETALSRLGSSKALYAVTDGGMDAGAVAAAAATETAHAARVFDDWADDGGPGAATFAAAADRARDGLERVEPDGFEPGDAPPLYDHLADLDDPVERAAALLARALVTGKTFEQMIGFHVGNADPRTAETFRGLRDAVATGREDAVDLLDDLCGDEADWERAFAAGDDAVAVAYDDYVSTLEAMGIEPKNVC